MKLRAETHYGNAEAIWLSALIDQMTRSIKALSQFIPLTTIVLSSYAPQAVCQEICDRLGTSINGVKAIASDLAPSPKAIGAASLPFSFRFMVE